MLIMGKPIKQLCPPYRFFAPYYIPSFIAFGSCCMLSIFWYRVFLNETKNNLCILKVEFQVPRVSCPIYNYARLAWPPADCFSFYALFLSFCLLTASHSNNEYVGHMREVWRGQNKKRIPKGGSQSYSIAKVSKHFLETGFFICRRWSVASNILLTEWC